MIVNILKIVPSDIMHGGTYRKRLTRSRHCQKSSARGLRVKLVVVVVVVVKLAATRLTSTTESRLSVTGSHISTIPVMIDLIMMTFN
jgi:hypothetical protein